MQEYIGPLDTRPIGHLGLLQQSSFSIAVSSFSTPRGRLIAIAVEAAGQESRSQMRYLAVRPVLRGHHFARYQTFWPYKSYNIDKPNYLDSIIRPYFVEDGRATMEPI